MLCLYFAACTDYTIRFSDDTAEITNNSFIKGSHP